MAKKSEALKCAELMADEMKQQYHESRDEVYILRYNITHLDETLGRISRIKKVDPKVKKLAKEARKHVVANKNMYRY